MLTFIGRYKLNKIRSWLWNYKTSTISFVLSWASRPMTDDLLLSVVEESHCLVGALHQQMSNLIPVHLRGLFEDKCLEALLASPTRPPPTANAPGLLASPFRSSMTGSRRPLMSSPAPFTPSIPPPLHHHMCSTPPLPLMQPSLPLKVTCDVACQTFSTGEIRVLDLYYD